MSKTYICTQKACRTIQNSMMCFDLNTPFSKILKQVISSFISQRQQTTEQRNKHRNDGKSTTYLLTETLPEISISPDYYLFIVSLKRSVQKELQDLVILRSKTTAKPPRQETSLKNQILATTALQQSTWYFWRKTISF